MVLLKSGEGRRCANLDAVISIVHAYTQCRVKVRYPIRFRPDLIGSRPLIHPSGRLEARESGASTVYRTCPAVLCVSTVE